MKEETLDLDRFAEVLAHVAHVGHEGSVLDGYGIEPETWRRSRQVWLRRLAAVRPPTHESHQFSTHYARSLLALQEGGDASARPSARPVDDEEAPITVMAQSLEPATMFRPAAGRPAPGVHDALETTAVSPSPDRRTVDAPAFVMRPLMDATFAPNAAGPGPARPPRPDASASSTPSSPLPPTGAPSAPVDLVGADCMNPEGYAKLAYATHLAPSVMRAQVHRAAGIADEAQRAEIDRAMTAYFAENEAAYRVYLEWIAHLRASRG
ncbi:MAG: hypothetical protein AAGN82_01175 [Myxococcota bacterium]